MWLHRGVVQADGATGDVLREYRRWIEETTESTHETDGATRLLKVNVSGAGDAPVRTGAPVKLTVVLTSSESIPSVIYVGVSEGTPTPIFVLRRDVHLHAGDLELQCSIASLPLPRGRFYVWIGLLSPGVGDVIPWQPAAAFEVVGPDLDTPPPGIARTAPVHVAAEWVHERIQ